jgi:hypothetical protein
MPVQDAMVAILTGILIAIAGGVVVFGFKKKYSPIAILWLLVVVAFLYLAALAIWLFKFDSSKTYNAYSDGVLRFVLWYSFVTPIYLLLVVWVSIFAQLYRRFRER